MKVRKEPLIGEENFQEPQMSENDVSEHELEDCLKCNICDSYFKLKKKLKNHIRSVHEGIKPFQCTFCDARFVQKHHLIRHIAA